MQYLKVSALVIATTILAAGYGPARAEKDRGGRSVYDRICGTATEHGHHHRMAKRLADYLNLTEAQKAAYKEFVDARIKAVEDAKAIVCNAKPDLSTFESRLQFHQTMLEARLAALKNENPKLLAFYNSLDDGQKKKFDEFRSRRDRE